MPTGKNSSNSSDQDKKGISGNKTTGSHRDGSTSSSKSGNSGQHATDSSLTNKGKGGSTASSTRVETHEQHVETGRQSHKNS